MSWHYKYPYVISGFLFESLCLLFFAHCTHKFYQYKNSHFFERRRISIISLELVFLWAHAIVQTSFTCFFFFVPDAWASSFSQHYLIIVGTFFRLEVFTLTVWMFIVAIRMYLMQYDDHHSAAIAHKQWRQHLRLRTSRGFNEEWYTTHRKTFGSFKWIRKYLYFLVVLDAISSVVYVMKPNPLTFWVPFSVLNGLSLIIICVSWAMTYATYDELGIRRELEYTVMIWIGMPVILATLNLVTTDIGVLLVLVSYFVLMCASAYMSTLWVIRYNTQLDVIAKRPILKRHASSLVSKVARIGSKNDIQHDEDDKVQGKHWIDQIQTSRGFEIFADFLVKSYSIENLLFLTEFMQFKNEFKQEIAVAVGESTFKIDLPETVLPTDEESRALHMQYHSIHAWGLALFEKYVEIGSDLEINISHRKRKSLIEIFRGETQRGRGSVFRSFTGFFRSDERKEVVRTTDKLVSAHVQVNSDSVGDMMGQDDGEIIELYDACAEEISVLLSDSFRIFCVRCGQPLASVSRVES